MVLAGVLLIIVTQNRCYSWQHLLYIEKYKDFYKVWYWLCHSFAAARYHQQTACRRSSPPSGNSSAPCAPQPSHRPALKQHNLGNHQALTNLLHSRDQILTLGLTPSLTLTMVRCGAVCCSWSPARQRLAQEKVPRIIGHSTERAGRITASGVRTDFRPRLRVQSLLLCVQCAAVRNSYPRSRLAGNCCWR